MTDAVDQFNGKSKIIVLSGAIASGKTTLAKMLMNQYGAKIISTRQLILSLLPKTEITRTALQKAGDTLDNQHKGNWISEALMRTLKLSNANNASTNPLFVIDSVRTINQLIDIRNSISECTIHVHLTASGDVLKKRFNSRNEEIDSNTTYINAKNQKKELEVPSLATVADLVLDTEIINTEEIAKFVMSINSKKYSD